MSDCKRGSELADAVSMTTYRLVDLEAPFFTCTEPLNDLH